jgi:tetratricopeptide (TPR) repeat protein
MTRKSSSAIPTAERYRQKALAEEKQGRLQEALFAWRIAAQLDPSNKQIQKNIKQLEQSIRNSANKSYRRGLAYFRAGDDKKARQSLLKTLRLMPNHSGAKTWLTTYLNARGNKIYQVQPGDSYTKIALKKYNDPTKAYLIAYFNDLNPQKPLMIGKLLILPNLDPKLMLPRKDIEALLERAQSALEQQRYQEVVHLTEQIKTDVPGHRKASILADTANYQIGLALIQKKQYQAAVDQLKQVRPSFKDRNKAINIAIEHLNTLDRQKKLKQAQDYLDQKDFESALQISEALLEQYPDASQAKSIDRKARYIIGKQLIDQDRDLEAVAILTKLDRTYEDTAQLLAQAHGKLNARAETHYRNGVKHFLNEELELAVKEWKEALRLNPNHPKAAQDIEDAERLLKKWRGLETIE